MALNNLGFGPGFTPVMGSPDPIPTNAQRLTDLYAGVGKTGGLGGGLVDQQGWDFWMGKLANGEDIAPAFNSAAQNVYSQLDTDAGKASPYAQQNRHGYNAMTRTNDAAFDAVQRLNAQTAGQSPATGQQAPEGAYQGPGQSSYSFTSTPAPAAPVSTANLQNYQQNPFLTQMGAGLRDQFTGFMNDGLASNRSGASAAGQYGGSRQGIAEARTMTDAGRGFSSALANLYGGDFENQMRRNLQQYQGDQQFALGNRGLDINATGQANQYDLGRRGVDLGYTNSDRNFNLGLGQQALTDQGQQLGFYSDQRGQDRADVSLGASLYGLGTQGQWSPVQNATGVASPWAGNGTATNTTQTGGGTQGAIGGAGLGLDYARRMGWLT